jgi:hypothetical protein
MMISEMPEKSGPAGGVQARNGGPDPQSGVDSSAFIGKRCTAIAKSGQRCRARPLTATALCSMHTPGYASMVGRKGGLNRKRPVPPKKVMRDPAVDDEAPRTNEVSDMDEPFSALDVRKYIERVTRLAVAGRLDPALAKIAVAAAPAWLKSIELSDRQADVEKRLLALEKAPK